MKYSLGLLLALCLVGLQLIAVMIVVSSSYVTSERVLLDHARSLLSDAGTNTTTHSFGFLDPARGAAELSARLAENKIVSSENREQLEQLLFRQLQTEPQFSGVFYGDERGNFFFVNKSDDVGPFRSKIITHPEGARQTELIWRDDNFQIIDQQTDPADIFDPRKRPWYIEAKAAGSSIWTDPYIFFSSQSPGITIASPVINEDGQTQGIIGVDIEISAISEFLADLKIGKNGVAMIINRNEDVIAHPQPALLKAENDDGTFRFVSIAEITDPIARKAFGATGSGGALNVSEETFAEFTHEGETYVSMVVPMVSEELSWTIAIYAPESDFIGAIKDNRFNNIWIAAATALVTGIVGLWLANAIHRPVRAFAVRSALISQGEIDPADPQPKTYKELEKANIALTDQIKQRKASENQYGQTFDMASRGMAQIDPHTNKFIRVNEKLATTLGYDVDELLQLSPADLTHPDDAVINWTVSGADTGDNSINIEKRCVRKDGEFVWVRFNAIMIRDSEGKPLHAVATIDETTKERAAEAQINKLHRDLSHLARGELLDHMAAGLAHELNQPLTAITQNVDAALSTVQVSDQGTSELRQILNDLDDQAHRASDIIKALRGFARKDEDWKAPFDMQALLTQSLMLVNAEATEAGTAMTVDAGSLPQVFGIRVQIAQVLVNLLHNAIESIASSGDNLRQVNVSAQVVGDFVEVAVADSGQGIDPNIDLFGQFETSKSEGMGLGLSISRSIVEAGGGRMWHDETYTQGARFVFTVPVQKTPKTQNGVSDT